MNESDYQGPAAPADAASAQPDALSAQPDASPYSTLVLGRGGSGEGTVGTIAPESLETAADDGTYGSGVLCSTGCTSTEGFFRKNAKVTLIARSRLGSRFAGWQGACTGPAPICYLSMAQSRTTTAVFEARADLPSCPSDPAQKAIFTHGAIKQAVLGSVTPVGVLNPPGHSTPNPHLFLVADKKKSGKPWTHAHAPADAVITFALASWNQGLGEFEYALEFATCREIALLYPKVLRVPASLVDKLGPPSACVNKTFCIYDNLHVPVTAGEVVGTTDLQMGRLALEVHDARQRQLLIAPERHNFSHAGCALDYFGEGPEVSGKEKKALLISPIDPATGARSCGQVSQDLEGTAQGDWFPADVAPSFSEYFSLAFVTDPATLDSVISVGLRMDHPPQGVASGVPAGLYRFGKATTSGLINRAFPTVTPDQAVYCYQNLGTDFVILVTMPDKDHLIIKKVAATDCIAAPTAGPLLTDASGSAWAYSRH